MRVGGRMALLGLVYLSHAAIACACMRPSNPTHPSPQSIHPSVNQFQIPLYSAVTMPDQAFADKFPRYAPWALSQTEGEEAVAAAAPAARSEG
jgi:hypothetical protein